MLIHTKIANLIKDLHALYREPMPNDKRETKFKILLQNYCAEDKPPEPYWNLPEKLSRLNITAPSNWNDYNTYLLEGGTLEYEDWNRTTIEF